MEANRNLRMIPPGQLHHLPPPPPIPQGTLARAIASRRKTLAKPMAEACEANKLFLTSVIDKKEYSRTQLGDDGSAEGARSAGAFILTPHREGRRRRSPRRDRSPCHDSPLPSSRDKLSSKPIAELIRKKRERLARGSSSPGRDKSKARTDRSPRSSPPSRSTGPPPSVIGSPSPRPSGEKSDRNTTPRQEETEPRDTPPKSKTVLVPQTKSLTGSNDGFIFLAFGVS